MAKKKTYKQYQKEEYSSLIDQLDLTELQKKSMKSRWLDQMLWMDGKASKVQNKHYRFRLTTIIGGVILPAIVSLNFSSDNPAFERAKFWVPFGLSQIIAISAALEEFFQYGNKHRQYRQTAEGLKTEGWQFLQLSGPYTNSDHQDAFAKFAGRVELAIQEDVSAYVSTLMQQETEQANQRQKALDNVATASTSLVADQNAAWSSRAQQRRAAAQAPVTQPPLQSISADDTWDSSDASFAAEPNGSDFSNGGSAFNGGFSEDAGFDSDVEAAMPSIATIPAPPSGLSTPETAFVPDLPDADEGEEASPNDADFLEPDGGPTLPGEIGASEATLPGEIASPVINPTLPGEIVEGGEDMELAAALPKAVAPPPPPPGSAAPDF